MLFRLIIFCKFHSFNKSKNLIVSTCLKRIKLKTCLGKYNTNLEENWHKNIMYKDLTAMQVFNICIFNLFFQFIPLP